MDVSVTSITEESLAAMRAQFPRQHGDGLDDVVGLDSSRFMYGGSQAAPSLARDTGYAAGSEGTLHEADASLALRQLPGLVESHNFLGKGSFAFVWHCTVELSGVASSVAVKVRRRNPHHGAAREAELLSSLEHPNLIKPHMTIDEGPMTCFVLELCSGGDLRKLLHDPGSAPIVATLGLRARVLAMCDIVSCVTYLHSKDVLHRDLKPGNSLLLTTAVPGCDRLPPIKVADLDLSRHVNALMSRHVGTIRYMAPEMLESPEYGLAVDIYSAAILLFELCTGQVPYAHNERLKNNVALTLAVSMGQRPCLDLLPAAAPAAGVRGLLEDCWQEEPTERPCAAVMLKRIEDIAAALEQQP